MQFLDIFKVAWPIAVTLLPIVVAAGVLWLKSQFPTKAELQAVQDKVAADLVGVEQRLTEKMDEHDDRLDVGSRKMADHHTRISLVENECKQAPSRDVIQAELSQLSSRVRGVEAYLEGTNRQLTTLNDYLHTLIQNGLGIGGHK